MQHHRSLFIDSSNLEEIKKWHSAGVIDGVTTNQSVILNDGLKLNEVEKTIKKICREMKGKPVSVELTDSSVSVAKMIKEAERFASLADNIVVKVPLIPHTTKSLEVISTLVRLGIPVNVTTMMTYEQMILAILAARKTKKISFVSLFWGRSLEDQAKYRGRFDFMSNHGKVGSESDVNVHPRNITEATAKFIKKGGFDNIKIIVGSIRTATMIGDAFAAGGNIVTAVPEILNAMLFSQRTIETIEQFDDAWKALVNKKHG